MKNLFSTFCLLVLLTACQPGEICEIKKQRAVSNPLLFPLLVLWRFPGDIQWTPLGFVVQPANIFAEHPQ